MMLGNDPDVPLALAIVRHSEARYLLATYVDPMAQRKAENESSAGWFLASLSQVTGM